MKQTSKLILPHSFYIYTIIHWPEDIPRETYANSSIHKIPDMAHHT